MSLQNIGAANSDDAFYRYKMPRMITKIEGRGNGIKTNIVNMVDIAKALARPASYTTKYFGCELGAQSKFDEKTGISLVNGAHDTQKLAGLLENFIKKYIQCYGCGNPETEIIITKTQMLNLKCAACGFVSDVDMRDKLTTFILKNPPEAKKGSKDKKAMRRAEKERLKEGEAVDEGQKKIKKDSKKKGLTSSKAFSVSRATVTKKTSSSDEEHSSPPGSQAEDNDADEEDDIQWQTDTSLEAAKKRIQEQLTAVTADMVILSTNDHEQKDKETKQIEKENAKTNGVCLTNDNSGYNNIVVEIKDLLQKGSKPSQVAAFVSSLAGSPQEIMTALFEALFDGVTKGFAKEVGKKKSYLAAVARDEASQGDLLLAIEAFCRKSVADVLKEVAVVAKVLYDADILEEEPIMQWYGDGVAGSNKNSAIWRNMYPFIEWLRSAESQSEEE